MDDILTQEASKIPPTHDYLEERSSEASDNLSGFLSDTSDLVESEDEADWEAELEWQENIRAIRILFEFILFPFLGKYIGRKFSFWAWERYMGRNIQAIAR